MHAAAPGDVCAVAVAVVLGALSRDACGFGADLSLEVAKLGVAHADARVQDNYLHVPTAQALHTQPP